MDYDVKIEWDVLEKLLLADSGNEFLEIERFEVRNVFESFFIEGLYGRGEHCLCVWMALAEVSVRVLDYVGAFAGSVTDE